MTLPRTVN